MLLRYPGEKDAAIWDGVGKRSNGDRWREINLGDLEPLRSRGQVTTSVASSALSSTRTFARRLPVRMQISVKESLARRCKLVILKPIIQQLIVLTLVEDQLETPRLRWRGNNAEAGRSDHDGATPRRRSIARPGHSQ